MAISGSTTFNHLEFKAWGGATQYTISPSSIQTILGNLTFAYTDGREGGFQVNGGTLALAGGIGISAQQRITTGTTTLELTGANDQTLTSDGGGLALATFRVNKTGGTASFVNSWEIRKLILQQGTLKAPSQTLMVTGDWINTGGTFLHNNGTVFIGGVSLPLGSFAIDVNTTETFNNLRVGTNGNNAAITIATGDTLITQGEFEHNGAALNGGTVEIRGNLKIASTGNWNGAGGGTTTYIFKGDSTVQTVTHTSGTPTTSQWIIDKSSGRVALATNLTLSGVSQRLSVQRGVLDLSDKTLSLTGTTAPIIEFLSGGSPTLATRLATLTTNGKIITSSVGRVLGLPNATLEAQVMVPNIASYTVITNGTAFGSNTFANTTWPNGGTGIVRYDRNSGKDVTVVSNSTNNIPPNTKYWSPTVGNNWSEPLNWVPYGIPTASDSVIFSSAFSDASCLIDMNVSIQSIELRSPYAGTLTQGQNIIITTSGSFVQTSGAFIGSNTDITVNSFSLSGGAFTSTTETLTVLSPATSATPILSYSGGSFNHANGTLRFRSLAAAYVNTPTLSISLSSPLSVNHLVYEGSTAISSGDTGRNWQLTGTAAQFNVAGNFTIRQTAGVPSLVSASSGVIAVSGQVSIDVGANGGTTLVTGTGSQDQTYAYTGGVAPRLVVDKTSGTFGPATGTTDLQVAALTLTRGSFIAPLGTLTILAETFTNSPIFTYTGGSFDHSGGTIRFRSRAVGYINWGTLTISLAAPLDINHLIYEGATSTTSGDNGRTWNISGSSARFNVLGNLTIQQVSGVPHSVSADGGQIFVSGNVAINTGAIGGTTVITATGTRDQTTSSTGGISPPLVVDKTGGSLAPAAGASNFQTASLFMMRGNFIAPTATLTILPQRFDGVPIFNYSGGNFTHSNGTLLFRSIEKSYGGADHVMTISLSQPLVVNNLIYEGARVLVAGETGRNWTLTGAAARFIVENNFTIRRVSGVDRVVIATGGTIEAKGNISIEAFAGGGTTAITFSGGNSQTISHLGGTAPQGTWTVDKSSGTVTLATDVTLTGASQTLSLLRGTLDLSNKTLTLNGATAPKLEFPIGSTGVLATTLTNATTFGRIVMSSAGRLVGVANGSLTPNVVVKPAIENYSVITTGGSVGAAPFSQVSWPNQGAGYIDYSKNSAKDITVVTNAPAVIPANTKYWYPTQGNVWSNAANWAPTGLPTTTDTVIFSPTFSVQPCSIDQNVSVLGITVESGYTGTITQGAGKTITLGSGGYSQAAGSFEGGDSTISLPRINLTGGTFKSTSGRLSMITTYVSTVPQNVFVVTGASFLHNNGNVVMGSTAGNGRYPSHNISADVPLIFNDLTLTSGNGTFCTISWNITGTSPTVTTAGTLKMQRDPACGGGTTFASGTIDVKGNLVVGDGLLGGDGVVRISGTGDQTYAQSVSTSTLPVLDINKSSGAVLPATGTTVLGVDSLRLTQGSFTAPSGTLFLRPRAAGPSPYKVLVYSGTPFVHSSGTVALVSTSGTGQAGSYQLELHAPLRLFNVQQQSGAGNSCSSTWSLVGGSANLVAEGNYAALAQGSCGTVMNNGVLEVLGNTTFSTGSSGGTTQLRLTGVGEQRVTHAAGQPLAGTWTIDKTAGSVLLAIDSKSKNYPQSRET
jgi:hypothetical protein